MTEASPSSTGCKYQATSVSDPNRRTFFSRIGEGLCGAALTYLLGNELVTARSAIASTVRQARDLRPREPDFRPRAKAVIQFFMNGGPSQVDLFDPKPTLARYAGQLPRELLDQVGTVSEASGLMPSPFKFSKQGESGIEISELLPHLAKCVDEMTVIRSMWTTTFNHSPAIFMLQSGRSLPGHPALGAWVIYGLGSENQNLPAYVVLDDPKGPPLNGTQNWQSGSLPPLYQGTRLRSEGSALLNLRPKGDVPTAISERARSLLNQLASAHQTQRPGQPDLAARIASYELAARLQVSATDALNISRESDATREMYGLNDPATASYGRRCLMARRLVERGVRMIQIYMKASPWDHHFGIENGLRQTCRETDQPVAALLRDLKQRGLLESTLLIWGGEFGRLPLSQAQGSKEAGRDHGASGFTIWLAGGGVKAGMVHGATDEFGYRAMEQRVSVHDFHATILHLLGLNHQDLAYDHHGLNERLSGVEPASVVREILA